MRHAIVLPLLGMLCAPLACKKKQAEPIPLPGPEVAAPEKLEIVAESEPNDDSKSPQLLSRSSEITGSFSPAAGKADDDWYKIDLGGAVKLMTADLTAIPTADTAIEVFDADRNKLFRVNLPGDGTPERVSNVTATGALYLKLTHAKKEGAGGPYTFTVRLADPKSGEEIEPNNKWVAATPLSTGAPLSGYVGYPEDEDWYAVDLKSAPPGGVLRLELSGVPELRSELSVATGSNQAIFHTVRASDLGETLTIRNLGVAAAEQTYYAVVRGAPFKGKTRTFSTTERYTLSASFEDSGSEMEFEPNDDSMHASEIFADGLLRSGYLAPKSDADWFVLHQTSDQGAFLRAELLVPDRTDMVISVFRVPAGNTDKPEDDRYLLMKVNDGELREPEVIPTLWVPPGDTYFKIEGAFKNLDGKWVRDYENTKEPYKLVYKVRPAEGEAEEQEPNNSIETATALKVGDALRGFVAPRKDMDHYKLEIGDDDAGPHKVSVTGILKVDVAVYLYGHDGKEVLTSADKGKGENEEKFEYNFEAGTYYIQVKDSGGRESNAQDAYQLSIK